MQADSVKYAGYDALLLIENFIRTKGGEYTKEEIRRNCSTNIDYQKFEEIFTYLTESKKIAEDSKGHICWIYNPELVKKYPDSDELRII